MDSMWAILPLRASRAVAAARRCPVYAVLLSVLLSSYGSMQSRRLRALRAFVYRLRNVTPRSTTAAPVVVDFGKS